MQKQRGFTLIEILVTSIILTSIIMVSSLSFSFFAERWNKLDKRLNVSKVEAKNSLLIHQAFEHILDIYLKDESEQNKLFFFGEQDRLVAVTSKPVSGLNSASVFELSLVTDRNNKFNLLYREWDITDRSLYTLMQVNDLIEEEEDFRLIVFQDTETLSFTYLGVERFIDYLGASAKSIHESDVYRFGMNWYQSYDSSRVGVLPKRVMLNFKIVAQERSVLFNINSFNSYKQSYMVLNEL